MLAALSDHGVDEAFVNEGAVDAFAGHEIDQVLKGHSVQPVVERLHILLDFLGFLGCQDYLQLLKRVLDALVVQELVWQVLQLVIYDDLKCDVLFFESVLELLVYVIEFLPQLELIR